jgi:hypothetical protein
MKYRKLRIALSTLCGIACVLLVVLWARSYRWCDVVKLQLPWRRIYFVSAHGEVRCEVGARRVSYWFQGSSMTPSGPAELNLTRSKIPASKDPDLRPPRSTSFLGFRLPNKQFLPIPVIPHWFIILLGSAFVALNIRPYTLRFSLRTLLIATTLVAVGLGLIVWLR